MYVAGHLGLVGSALWRALGEVDGIERIGCSRSELDLEDQTGVFRFFDQWRPDFVFLAAAKVGGILANDTWPADFIRSNLAIQCNVIEAARRTGVQKLMFLGSSCVYPKLAPQPIPEDALLTGPLEPTNEAYAVAKIAGIQMCRAYNRQFGTRFISVMPTNLYGPGDNFDLQSSHVLPAMLRRFHEAKSSGADAVTLWGSGAPRREFLHVDDMADACVFIMGCHEGNDLVNIGFGSDVSIRELAVVVGRIVGFGGSVRWDTSKPDGTPRKLLDTSRLRALGWRPRISLEEGVETTYRWFLEQRGTERGGRT